jgi:hypothetical protein
MVDTCNGDVTPTTSFHYAGTPAFPPRSPSLDQSLFWIFLLQKSPYVAAVKVPADCPSKQAEKNSGGDFRRGESMCTRSKKQHQRSPNYKDGQAPPQHALPPYESVFSLCFELEPTLLSFLVSVVFEHSGRNYRIRMSIFCPYSAGVRPYLAPAATVFYDRWEQGPHARQKAA